MGSDWFRNKSWSPEIEAAFFAKLARARSQRDQYLVIQALSIVPNHPDVTLRLVDLYFETRTKQFDDVRALLARADANLQLGLLDQAISTYKRVLEHEEKNPSQRTNTYLHLPYLVATRRVAVEYDYSLELLDRGLDLVTFPIDRFKWYAAGALILDDIGERETAKTRARGALDAASEQKSGFRYHPDLGLVGPEYEFMIQRLRKLAA